MGQVEKVVIVVFDGLRPDMIPGPMPTLDGFLKENLWFRNARSVFPSLTRVCTTSVATGAWPGRHGVVNNQFHQGASNGSMMIDTGRIDHLLQLKDRTGAIVTAESLGQRLASAGRRMTAIHCGSAGSGLLVNHTVREDGHATFSVHGEEATLTPEIVPAILSACGPLPGHDVPKLDVVAYAGRVATSVALAREQADVTLVWLPEPDTSYHFCGIHSEGSVEAMRAADAVFAEILESIASGPHAGSTAVIAMSDHGQIATSNLVDFPAALAADGFRAGFAPADETDILLTLGSMGELRPITADPGLISDLGRWLTGRDDVGMVFADPDLVDGALPLAAVHQTHPRSPDLVYIMRSDRGPGPGGVPGIGVYTGGVPVGGGMHGGLNPFEMNTVLAFSVPDGRRAAIDDAPASLIDIAPTISDLFGLGLDADGRALPLFEPGREDVAYETLKASCGAFEQQLVRARVSGCAYLIEGGRVAPDAQQAPVTRPTGLTSP